ncbi:MAG TPA: hypothetical protein DCY13_13725 [Verrucomicrobiales bacterium]|nr:hypothetical protein [Verrucomicrobiales bacterium]
MDLYQLEYFVEVARQGSFTKAAAKVGIVQPALSQQIKRLEEEFGTPLVVRDRRQARLTPAGETLLEHARQLLAMAQHTRESIVGLAELKHGRLTIAAIPAVSAFHLPAHINRFRRRHSGIELVILEESSSGVAELVANGTAELGFLQLPEPDQRLEGTALLSEPHLVLVHQRHRLAALKSVPLRQLAGEPFIQYRGKVRDSVLQACRQSGFDPKIACATGELATVHALTQAGLGIAILPRMAIPRGLKGVRAVPLTRPGLWRELGIVRRHGAPASMAAQAFLEPFSG